MKTDQLLSLLAADAKPVAPNAAGRRMGLALLAGLPVSVAIVALMYGVRADLAQVAREPMFLFKLGFPLLLAAAAFVAAQRLARPGVRAGRVPLFAMVLPVAAVWLLGLAVWFGSPQDSRAELLWGQTWRSCVFNIGLVALPVFAAALAALKTLAPTRPAWAGAAAGAMAGGAGAAVYALHCPELAAPFLAVWYVLGIAMPALLGAVLGSKLLRW